MKKGPQKHPEPLVASGLSLPSELGWFPYEVVNSLPEFRFGLWSVFGFGSF